MDFSLTDQSQGVPAPPLEKPAPDGARRVSLPRAGHWQGVRDVALHAAVAGRRSRRQYAAEPLTLDELAFLLWATQGVTRPLGPGHALRTVPSAGVPPRLRDLPGRAAA